MAILLRLGQAWSGMARRWCGRVRLGTARFGRGILVWSGTAGFGRVGQGRVWLGPARCGRAR